MMKTRSKAPARAENVKPVPTLSPLESLRALHARLSPLAKDETLAGIKTVTLNDKIASDAFIDINGDYLIRAIDGIMFEMSHQKQKQHLPVMDADGMQGFVHGIDAGQLLSSSFKNLPQKSRDFFMVSINHQIAQAQITGLQLVP